MYRFKQWRIQFGNELGDSKPHRYIDICLEFMNIYYAHLAYARVALSTKFVSKTEEVFFL